MGEALVAAVSTALNADDGCNAGFLRPDALLVVTPRPMGPTRSTSAWS